MSDARKALVALIDAQGIADAIQAAGWTPPGERVKPTVEDVARVALAEALTRAADRCCQCVDGHHDQMPPYGTDDDVRISRDDARKIAAALLPGRTEAEVKAEVLRDAADDVVAEEFLRALPPAEYGENAVESAAAWLRRRADLEHGGA